MIHGKHYIERICQSLDAILLSQQNVGFRAPHCMSHFLRQDWVQSGRCSPAKHRGAYFSAVYGFMKDPIAAPGPYENQEVENLVGIAPAPTLFTTSTKHHGSR